MLSVFHRSNHIILLLGLVSLMGASYQVLMPVYAKDILHGDSHTFGFLMGAAGAGALLGRNLSGIKGKRFEAGKTDSLQQPHSCLSDWLPLHLIHHSLFPCFSCFLQGWG